MTSIDDLRSPAGRRGQRSRDLPRRSPLGNARLTALTGTVLLVLLAVQGLTLLSVRRLITVHVFVGLLLIGPVALKAASTLHRFARYYSGDPVYRCEPRPHPVMRLLGPAVIVTSGCLLGSGVALVALGRQWESLPLLTIHQAFFWCWVTVTGVHVLGRVWRLPGLVGPEVGLAGGARVAGRALRWSALAGALVVGLGLALAGVHLAAAWSR